jgi:uncharacterized membrane protein (UPF0182 family)
VAQTGVRSRRRWVLLIVAALLLLLFLLAGLSGFYVDILWFREMGQSGVFWTTFWSKALLGFIFGLIFFVLLMANLLIVRRLAPRFRVFSPEQEVIERYRAAFEPYARYLVPAFAAVIAIFVGVAASAQWKTFLLWRSSDGVSFGNVPGDALFHKDASFYIFRLPFQQFVQGWFFSALVGITVIVAVAHYLTGGIRTQTAGERVTPQVKAHLSVLLGLIMLVKAYGYYLGKYNLLTSSRGVVTGASYTDIHAQLPALRLLVFIAIVCAALFLVNIRFRGWALPVIGIGLLGISSIVVGALVPAAVQKFSVDPQQQQRESPYITDNIQATQYSFGLDKIALQDASPASGVTPENAKANEPTIANIRLWNPNILVQNYQQLQRLQQYYEFTDVDIDRYPLQSGAETDERQVMISAREITQEGIPGGGTWQNRHLVYTHGYASVASLVNSVTTTGAPNFLLYDIPPVIASTGASSLSLTNEGSQIYFGEVSSGTVPYLVVDTNQKELNYPSGSGSVQTSYGGKGGIDMGSFFRRLVFAYRYRDINLLISGLITGNSKILINRDLTTRVTKLAPFLKYDGDPYVAAIGGHLYYIWDAYTTTNLYPYGQEMNLGDATTPTSLLKGQANYVRNSVKVAMNVYDGTVRFYVTDPSDPLIQVWEKAFPALFVPVSQAPQDLQQHFRYPEDMLTVQAYQFQRYHVTNAQTFYSNERVWTIPGALPVSPSSTAETPQTASTTDKFRPYYVLSKVPGSDAEHFVLFEPFTPPNRSNMVAYLAAGSDDFGSVGSSKDAGLYGNLSSLQFPTNGNVVGPAQARSLIQQDPTASAQITLLNQQSSGVSYGDLLIVPMGDSFLYVQPIFLKSSQNALPQLKLVAVVNGGNVYLGTNLDDALTKAFGQPTGGTCPDGSQPDANGNCPTQSGQTVSALLAQAQQEFDAANAALKAGDLAGYQQHVNAAQNLIAQATKLLSQQGGGTGGTGGTGASPTPTPSGSP